MNVLSAPSSELISSEFIGFDSDTGIARMAFVAPESFASPRGLVQGGLIGAFLDEAMGSAVLQLSEGKLPPLNLDFNISCIAPVPIGKLTATGRALKMGRTVAYLEGELFDGEGKLVARATSTAMLTEVPDGEI